MNTALFQSLYMVAHQSSVGDILIIFTAEFVHWWLLAGAAVFLWYTLRAASLTKRLRAITALGVSTAIAWGVTQTLKLLIAAPRPFEVFDGVVPLFVDVGGYALPSGHATFSFAIATFLFCYNRVAGLVAFVVALSVGMARVMAGVHFPVDVLGGFVVGSGVVLALHYLYRRLGTI